MGPRMINAATPRFENETRKKKRVRTKKSYLSYRLQHVTKRMLRRQSKRHFSKGKTHPQIHFLKGAGATVKIRRHKIHRKNFNRLHTLALSDSRHGRESLI